MTLNNLRSAVDCLTQPHVVEISDAGRLLGHRTDPPLLAQLRADITGGNSSTGSGARTQDHARNLINPEAHKLYTDIETRVRAWARRSGHERATNVWPHPEAVLRTWYANAYTRTDAELAPYEATISGWIENIHDLLDPPHRFDINAPCPNCHTTWTITRTDGHEQHVQALGATDYDPPQQHRSTVTCRACGALWEGIDGAEHLAAELANQPELQETHA